MSRLVRAAHRWLQACGVDLKRYTALNDPNLRRQEIMSGRGIEIVIDGGANVGEYAQRLRMDGYSGRIHSFEPRSMAFTRLATNCSRDPDWFCHCAALGDEAGERQLSVSANGVSSSFLSQTEGMSTMLPGARVAGVESVQMVRMEEMWDELAVADLVPMLKLDVQGFERRALDGAGKRLRNLQVIELELSMTALYDTAPSLEECIAHLRSEGFDPVSLEPNSYDSKTARVFEANAIFARRT